MTSHDPGEDMAPQRRRRALEAFMARHQLRAAEWARAAGLPSANALYNFLNGHSKSLGQATLERLVRAVPNASITEMIGEAPPTRIAAETVSVRVAAEAGRWRATYEAALAPEPAVALPPSVKADEAAIILDRHADEIYPAGSYVGVRALAAMRRALRDGDMVLVHRVRDGRHEVTVRGLVVTREKDVETACLVFRSGEAKYRTRIEIPWPYRGETFEVDGDTMQLRGRVTIMVLLHEAA